MAGAREICCRWILLVFWWMSYRLTVEALKKAEELLQLLPTGGERELFAGILLLTEILPPKEFNEMATLVVAAAAHQAEIAGALEKSGSG